MHPRLPPPLVFFVEPNSAMISASSHLCRHDSGLFVLSYGTPVSSLPSSLSLDVVLFQFSLYMFM